MDELNFLNIKALVASSSYYYLPNPSIRLNSQILGNGIIYIRTEVFMDLDELIVANLFSFRVGAKHRLDEHFNRARTIFLKKGNSDHAVEPYFHS